MPNLIETNDISGFKVYGQQMVEYTVQGNAGQDFGVAIAIASLSESTAIEAEASAYSAVLRARQRKLSEIGSALAVITKAIATLKTGSGQVPSDLSDVDPALETAKSILDRYGVTLNLTWVKNTGYAVSRENAEKARNDTEYALDMENNDMQQDMVTLQGLVSKRDNSFSTAGKVMKKVNATATSIIHSIGK